MDGGEVRPQRIKAGEPVQEKQMILGLEEGLGLVLAVNVDQLARHFAEGADGGQSASHKNPVLAGAGHHTLDEEFPLRLHTDFRQARQECFLPRQVEERLHGCLLGSRPD